ncbi:uncharacterized protein LOC129803657 [Phlebotomus papatasi]|uniref:uncharacterized protein LOC129803657 n=1 Tax=Phlebotomus papatasi TaxID=29031 RepID=UPI0024836982|nr:uncharacterized protein LOC129803657 [Phlebotomus papatasi]
MQRQRRKRCLDKPMKRWTLQEEGRILDFIMANQPMEVPTARVYYTTLINNWNWTVEPNLIRHKVKNMKKVYYKMLAWRQQAIETGDYDDDMIREFLKRRCPHFNKLQQLFSEDIKAKQAIASTRSYQMEEDLSLDHLDNMDSAEEDAVMDGLKIEIEEPDSPPSEEMPQFYRSGESTDPLRNQDSPETTELKKEHYSLQWMKLEIEKERLTIVREKIALQREQNQEEARYKILQLEQQERMKKLQIEKDAEVKMFELKLKYKAEPKPEM